MTADLDWVQAVGFQMEALHVGVLRHLLHGSHAVAVARALTGDERIAAVAEARTEARLIASRRRPVDLAARLTMDDGTDGELAVEVKVDSAWSSQQLRETVPSAAHGVLLALGRTHLAVTDTDIRHLNEEFEHPWSCAGPGDLAAIVERHAADDPQLTSYAEHLRSERDDTMPLEPRPRRRRGHEPPGRASARPTGRTSVRCSGRAATPGPGSARR